jgi:dTDP-4-dehydrorhamnose reductase
MSDKTMRILVTGVSGQVGWEIIRKDRLTDLTIIGLDRSACDLSDSQTISRTIEKYSPELIINCAAYTAVDKAETEPEIAFSVNRDGPAFIADACSKADIPLIHLSTDYVFDGKGKIPYKTSDRLSPLGVYGKSKEAGEQGVRDRLDRHLIIRTSWVYGIHGHNFVKTMLRFGRERKELQIVNDQYGCPTFARDLADALLVITPQILSDNFTDWGTYHCCGSTALSWYDFAIHIFAMARKNFPLVVKDIVPITTEQFPTPTPRPRYSVLDCQKIYSTFGIKLPEVKDSLKTFFNEFNKVGENI